MLQAIMIAFAISVDSFSVGVAYGVKNIKVPLPSIFILDIISVVLLALGLFTGNLLTRIFPPIVTNLLGSIIIIVIGIWFLIEGWLNYKFPKEKIQQQATIAFISIKSLGIAISVLRNPSGADLDVSGTIDTKEAMLLGFALAIDSLAVGIVVSINSLAIILSALVLVATMNFLFLLMGIFIGKRFLMKSLKEKTSLVPGFILIILGIIRLL
ncbi:sporulation membrane protein YtaF [Alkaliphilus serpentinus]|uniref:Sporulation membrane protein YtaF n=1 Tax=Alkaliphilus serpentinus TaxID=1482731 RepID=A0A833MDC8_9FIRM|nr:sporulation membrane protein YtaF [Alkaliphilus serpentinus]KAB3528801.1 sporulation membrane protein YtaF [Alkaliphilus serpentinus]